MKLLVISLGDLMLALCAHLACDDCVVRPCLHLESNEAYEFAERHDHSQFDFIALVEQERCRVQR